MASSPPTLHRSRRARRKAARAGATATGRPADGPTAADDRALRRFAAGVFVLALSLRLLHLWQIRRAPFFTVLMGDSLGYDLWARQIAAGDWRGQGVFYQAPLYPYTLGLLYTLFGHDPMVVRACQAVVGSASCALITLAGGRLFGARQGLAAGFLLAVYAPAIFSDGLLQKTVLDGVLLSALLLLVAQLTGQATRGRAVTAGIVLGCLALTRENALILFPVFLVWLWLRDRRAVAPALALTLGLGLVLAPVALRNLAVGGELHLTTSQLGPNLYIGNHEHATGGYVPLRAHRGSPEFERQDATTLAEKALGRTLGPAEVSRYWQHRALDWIRNHPGAWLALMAKKIAMVWNAGEASDTEDLESYAEWSPLIEVGGVLFHFGLLAPLGLLGMWLTRARWRELWILHAMVVLYTLSVAVFYVLARYRYPLVPVLTLFAGAAVVAFPGWWRRSGARERWVTAAAVGVVAVACNWPLHSTTAMRGLTHYNMGSRLQAEGRGDEALEQYRRALELLPDRATAHVHANAGALLTARGSHEEARRHLEAAVRLEPTLTEAQVNLGIELAATGRHAEAVEAFRRALALDARHALAQYNLGLALATMGRRTEATRALEEAIALDPSNAAAHNNLGILLASEGRLAEGIAHFEEAVRLQPGFREAEMNLARARSLR